MLSSHFRDMIMSTRYFTTISQFNYHHHPMWFELIEIFRRFYPRWKIRQRLCALLCQQLWELPLCFTYLPMSLMWGLLSNLLWKAQDWQILVPSSLLFPRTSLKVQTLQLQRHFSKTFSAIPLEQKSSLHSLPYLPLAIYSESHIQSVSWQPN